MKKTVAQNFDDLCSWCRYLAGLALSYVVKRVVYGSIGIDDRLDRIEAALKELEEEQSRLKASSSTSS